MKEMLKDKTIIAFIVIMLGITIISTPSTKLEETKDINDEYISCNLK